MKKKIIIGSIIILVIGGLIAANFIVKGGGVQSFGGGRVFEVKVKKIENGKLSSVVSADGVIEEIEKHEIYFESPLKVNKVLVQKNQKVSKGQKLLELDMDSLNSELEQARISKAKLEYALSKMRPGTATSFENNLVGAELAYNDAKKKYDNNKSLFQSGALSQSELDSSKKTLDDAAIALKNAQLGVSGSDMDYLSQEQDLRAAILRINDLESKIKKVNESALSPSDGLVAEANIVDGAYTVVGQASFKIVNPERIQIKADVKEFDVKGVANGQNVNIYGDAVDKSLGITGKVTSISPVAKKSKSATSDETVVEAVISIDKTSPVLKPGLKVSCDILTKTVENAVIASYEMFRTDKDENKSVLIVNSNNIIEERKVKTGIVSGLDVEILDGLKGGEMVVTNEQAAMKDGSRVKIAAEENK